MHFFYTMFINIIISPGILYRSRSKNGSHYEIHLINSWLSNFRYPGRIHFQLLAEIMERAKQTEVIRITLNPQPQRVWLRYYECWDKFHRHTPDSNQRRPATSQLRECYTRKVDHDLFGWKKSYFWSLAVTIFKLLAWGRQVTIHHAHALLFLYYILFTFYKLHTFTCNFFVYK